MAKLISAGLEAQIRRLIRDEGRRHKNDPPRDPAGGRNERRPNRRFKLTEALGPFGTAAVVWRYRDPSTGEIADSEETGEVTDTDGMEAESGTCGRAELVTDGPTPRWEVIALGCEPPPEE